MKKVIIIFFVLVGIRYNATSQIMKDPEGLKLQENATNAIYNLDFESSSKYIEALEKKFPHHPVVPLFKAYEIYWKDMPLNPDSENYNTYENELIEAAEKAEALYEKEKTPEATFYALSAHSLLTKLYGDENRFVKTINEASIAYNYLKEGFKIQEEYPEFYLYTGLYDFYRERYPESHPTIKPLIWLFAKGDIQKGLQELKIAATKAVLTKPEANKYLMIIYLKYLDEPDSALPFIEKLTISYPDNLYFSMLYVENLLVLKQYEKATPYIEKLKEDPNPYFRMAGEVFTGINFEKNIKDEKNASLYYNKAIETSEFLSWSAKNYISFAYAGLARIAIKNGDKRAARKNYRKAVKYAQYDAVKEEAGEYLGY
ncbi:tetratricopeptide repeat protein [Xanthovirga aplysinae]|uniref:tetratricopeptide repeat protein n=1 Tax=Xanthovirga aplysinae TaxID=2529853 RepID=UPI0012BCFB93|nr:hypothetical protein [Xanthovirga aplysinae]MTI33465.1 hypothetical protein [Xanthovirga aplysinae]